MTDPAPTLAGETELLPCPFCGHAMKVYEREPGEWNVNDTNFQCRVQPCLILNWETREGAIACWNSLRAPSPATAAGAHALLAEAESYRRSADFGNFEIGAHAGIDRLLAHLRYTLHHRPDSLAPSSPPASRGEGAR